MTSSRLSRSIALLVGVGLTASLAVAAPSAAAPRGWPVGPTSIGSMGSQADPLAIGSVRTWDAQSNWCDIQPTADADMVANLTRLLAPRLDAAVANGASKAIVMLGHPAPWVFDDHPNAVRRAKVWSCGLHASGISIPASSTITPGSVQFQRFADYAATVIGFVTDRYAGRLAFDFQVYNEPNLRSGLDPRLDIPGAAQTWKDAARALYAYEGIVRSLLRGQFAGRGYRLLSTALYQRSNTFSKKYLKLHARRPRVDVLAFNIYGWKGKSPNAMVKEWNRKAAGVVKQVRRHKRLRRLPAVITEANLHLVNNDHDKSNLRATIARDSTQRRLATATQMDAFYFGFSELVWLGPWRHEQAAVWINDLGGPARAGLATLRSALDGATIKRCKTRRGTRQCSFRAQDGTALRVLWRKSGTRRVRSPYRATVTEMTGAQWSVRKRKKIRVGTTPIVLRQA